MKKINKINNKIMYIFLLLILIVSATACGKAEKQAVVNTQEVENDYYIDLTELGMKLTIYLRLDGEGNFLFSNTLAFETNKSSGTFQKLGDEYIMVYSSVNGEEKSVSDGLTSSFVVAEDGTLDFSGCEKIYYGSASARTYSEDNPDASLIAIPVPENFEEPGTESAFQTGIYTAEAVTENDITYRHIISFYEDNSYLHVMNYEKDGKMMLDYEVGTYGVSTTQLALELENGERTECEVVNGSSLKVSLLPYENASERISMDFSKQDSAAELAVFSGEGTVTGSNEIFEVTVTLYEDGSYESIAEGFSEKGIMVIDSAEGYVKQYPDHPDTEVRGLRQVETVPSGAVVYEDDEKMVLNDLRIRNSGGLTRHKSNVAVQ